MVLLNKLVSFPSLKYVSMYIGQPLYAIYVYDCDIYTHTNLHANMYATMRVCVCVDPSLRP